MYKSTDFIYRNLDLQRDLTALVSLLKEADQSGLTEASLSERLTWSGQDPAPNNWVVTLAEDSSLIGYALIQKTGSDDNADLYAVVHPFYRRKGIGCQLLARMLEHASALGAQAARTYVDVQNEAAKLFVHQQGFEAVSAYTRMSASGTHIFPLPLWPQGFTVGSYDQIQRVELYTEAMNRCYEGLWGHVQCTQEEVASWLPQLNFSGTFLLFAPDGTIAGTCRADLSKDLTAERGVPTALIDAPGVVPAYRSAGLYLPLLLTTIGWALLQNPVMLELESWGDAPETLALYRSLGFEVIKEEISYRRSL